MNTSRSPPQTSQSQRFKSWDTSPQANSARVKPVSSQDSDLDGVMDSDSSDSQIDLLRGAPDDLDNLIEAAADVCPTEHDKLCGLEAQALQLQGAPVQQNFQENPKSGGDLNGCFQYGNSYNQSKRQWDQRQPRQHLTYSMQAKAKQYSYSYQKKFGPSNPGAQGNQLKNQNGKPQFTRPFTGKAGTKCQYGPQFGAHPLLQNPGGSSASNLSQVGQTSNFEWRCASAVQNVSFDPHQKRVFIAEADEGKITTLDLSVYPDSSSFKFRDQLRIQKYKTLLKGIEDSRLLSALPMKDYVALELVQANCQTYLVFTDRQTGTFKGAFHYQREIKSGFIFLNNEGPEEYDPARDETNTKSSAPGSTSGRETHSTDLASLADQQESEPIEQILSSSRVSLINDRHSNFSPVKNLRNPAQTYDQDLNQSDLSRSSGGLKAIRLSKKHADDDTPMTDSEPIVQHSQSSKQSPTTGTTSVGEAETQTKDKTTNPFYCSSSNTDQDMPEVKDENSSDQHDQSPSMLSGVIAIIEHGVQQFVMHLNPWTMASIAFPLNRNEFNSQSSACSRKSGELIQPEQLKLVDLGSTSMFGVLQDNRHFYVKQFVKQRTDLGEHIELLHISHIDFGSLAQSIQNYQGFAKPKAEPACPVLNQLVPLNRTDSTLVNLASSKRYLVYNYVLGQITKEILPLRGSSFKICSDWMFDLEKTPYITMYNANSIRRVDINTFEIKKNINLKGLSKDGEVAKFPLINSTVKSNYQWSNNKATQPFKYPYPNQAQYAKKSPYPTKYQKYQTRRPYDAAEHDNEIQEVILMPMMKLEPVPQKTVKVEEQQAPKTTTKFILHQLGQITIAIPQVVTDTNEQEAQKEPQQEEKSMYEKGLEQEKQKEMTEAIQTTTIQKTEPQQPYVPLQMNKEQRALFSAGMPVAAVHRLQQSTVQAETKPAKRDAAQPAFVNSILDNGQRLLVIVGKERRLIKLL